MTKTTVKGFEVRLDRAYDLTHHMWVHAEGGKARIGMDALGLETSGTLAHLAIEELDSTLAAGDVFGSLEAEKYVGPLIAPLSGRVTRVNQAAIENPVLVQTDPYGEGWLIEIEPTDLHAELDGLVRGEEAIIEAFSKKVTEYRLEGVLAE